MKNILILSFLLFLLGCSKEDKELVLQGSFKTSETAIIDPVVLYTQNSTITDQTTIINYLNKKWGNPTAYFQFNEGSESFGNSSITFSFTDSKNLTVHRQSAFGSKEGKAEIFSRIGNEILIQMTEKDTVPGGSVNYNPYDPVNGILVLKYIPEQTCTEYSSSLGYDIPPPCLQNDIIPLVSESNELYLPLISFFASSRAGTTSYYKAAGNRYNILVPDLNHQLSINDTVVVQTKRIQLIKQ